MKLRCEKFELLSAILRASRAASAKSPVPALEGLLFETLNESVRLTGYDLKIGIMTTIPAEIDEPGSIVLNARLFGEIVRRLPGDLVTVTLIPGNLVKIECEMSEFEISGTVSSDYPELPSVESNDTVNISEFTLKNMISQTNFAVSDNESRPIHTGALFDVRDGALTVVAVDGFRLAMRRERFSEDNSGQYSFVVPGTALSEVEKLAGDNENTVGVTVGAKHIMFSIGETILISRRLEGEFLNYRQSIPSDSKYSVIASRREMIESVERVSLLISDKLKSPLRCTFGDGVLKLQTNSSLGRASDECTIDGNCDDLEIGFNNKYVLDALRAAPSENIRITLNTGVSPCVIAPPDDADDTFLYMILPVRLKSYDS